MIKAKNNDETCFQYAKIAALYHALILKDPPRISRSNPFINPYEKEELKLPPDLNEGGKIFKNKCY